MTLLPTVTCRLCSEVLSAPTLEFGSIPIGNRFGQIPGEAERLDLAMVGCSHCGLVQLAKSPSPEALVPRLPWIRYREPEGHLDVLAETLTVDAVTLSAVGVGPFEEPFLKRLQTLGWSTTEIALIDEGDRRDGHYPYLETWQSRISEDGRLSAISKGKRYDLVSCRYLLEHSSDPLKLLRSLATLLAPGGRLVIEVPDSSQFLSRRDYCFPWEEHSCYFVEATFAALCSAAGFAVGKLCRFPGQLEDALVAVLEAGVPNTLSSRPSGVFEAYLNDYSLFFARIRRRLAELAGGHPERVALFGIGHQAIMFANVFGLDSIIGVAVDDEPNKLGLYPPGLSVPITSSEALLSNDEVTVCLLAVSPLAEARVRERLAPLVERGVQFFSIFSGVPGSISIEG